MDILKNNGIKVGERNGRKYYFNEKYFDAIDNEHKAYWLGFIYADGSHSCKRYSLRICLKKEDAYILKEFYKDIGCNREISYFLNKQYNQEYAYAYVQHPYLSKTLLEKGVPADKSFKIIFPPDNIVPETYKKDFIRGYFDGDGCISNPKIYYKISYSITGNYDFLNGLKKYLLKNIKTFTDIPLYKSSNSDVYTLSRGGINKVQEFLDYIYEDSTIYLKRKHELYLKLLKYKKEHMNG